MSLKLALCASALALASQAHAKSSTQVERYFDDLKGAYDVEMTIGHRVFSEELLITDVIANRVNPAASRSIEGVYNVPGIFVAKLEKGVVMREPCGSVQNSRIDLLFTITADENGTKYPVNFVGSGDRCEIYGEAKLADGTHLGSFKAVQNSPDCSAGK